MKSLAAAVLALATTMMTTTAARAQAGAATAQCTVTELVASNEKKGVDPKLDHFKGKLTKPPFTAFDSFAFLGEQTLSAERSKPLSSRLVNGNLTLLFKDKTVEKDGKARLRVGIEHDGKDGTRVVSTVVSFDSGDAVLVGGKPFESGTYFLALSCSSN